MGGDLPKINNSGFYEAFIYTGTISILRKVRLGLRNNFSEGIFEVGAGHLFSKLDGPARILYHLNCLDARKLIEEPSAARIHEHCMSLDLHELKDSYPFVKVQILQSMVFEKAFDPLRSAVYDYANVVIPGAPGVFQIFLRLLLEYGGKTV